jgi:DNA-directed RNA polymerase subunit RPC12/RpoP
MTSPSEYTILEIQLRASIKRMQKVKELWRTYQWACRSCGRFLYEARVPSGRTVSEYKPVECGGCGSTLISEREKA